MANIAISVSDKGPDMWPLAQNRDVSLHPVGSGRTTFGRAMDKLFKEGCRKVVVLAQAGDIACLAREIPAGMKAVFEAASLPQRRGKGRLLGVADILKIPLAYPWDLLRYHLELMKTIERQDPILKRCIEDYRWSIRGNVHIEEDVYVAASAIVRGPCVLKRGAQIHDRAVVKGSYIGEGAIVGTGATVKNSIVYDHTKLRHGAIILHSIIGEDCNVGPGTTVSDIRLDGRNVESCAGDNTLSTGLEHFGAVIGAHTITGTSVSIRAGVKIGPGCRLNSGICIASDVPDFTEVDFKDSPVSFTALPK